MAWLYGALAAFAAVGCEAYFAAHRGQAYLSLALVALPLAVLVNVGIWGILQSETILGVAVIFSLFTAATRIAWTLHLGEPVSPAAWLAFALVLSATFVKLAWRPA